MKKNYIPFIAGVILSWIGARILLGPQIKIVDQYPIPIPLTILLSIIAFFLAYKSFKGQK